MEFGNIILKIKTLNRSSVIFNSKSMNIYNYFYRMLEIYLKIIYLIFIYLLPYSFNFIFILFIFFFHDSWKFFFF